MRHSFIILLIRKINLEKLRNKTMNYKIIFWLLILIWTILEIIWDILFKKWATDNKFIFIVIWFAIYALWTVFWAYSLKYENLSKAISIFTIFNLIIISIVWVVYFKESLSIYNIIWIILWIIAIMFIEM